MCSKIDGDPDLENETAAADARVVARSQKISLLPRLGFLLCAHLILVFFCSFLLVVNLRGFFFFFLGRKVCMTTRNIKPINSKKAPAFFLLLRLLYLDSLLFSAWIIRRRANRVIARCGLPINFLLVVHHHMWSYHLFIVCTCWCGVTLLIFLFLFLVVLLSIENKHWKESDPVVWAAGNESFFCKMHQLECVSAACLSQAAAGLLETPATTHPTRLGLSVGRTRTKNKKTLVVLELVLPMACLLRVGVCRLSEK